MVNEKAHAAKDMGNASFKAGDYPKAIGHYTTAILSDRTDATYPLNRAAAYLKLGKNEDAERDCTTVLGISSSNVKALFRRAQARIGLGRLLEAQKDLSQALLIEPSNTAAQEEMKKLTMLIQQEKAKKSKALASPVQTSLDPATKTKRRRIPIKIVDPLGTTEPEEMVPSVGKRPDPSPSTTKVSSKSPDTLEPIASRKFKPGPSTPMSTEAVASIPNASPSSSMPSSSSVPTTKSFADAKAARESTKPSRVGGGIFRASGESTIFPTREDRHAQATKQAVAFSPSAPTAARLSDKANGPAHQAPGTLFDLNKTWESLSSSEERWRYFNTIRPTTLPSLCQTSLEPSLLSSILQTFLDVMNASTGDSRTKERVLAYMDGFAKVPRFGTLLLFMSKLERSVLKDIWAHLEVDKPPGVWGTVV